LEQTDNKRKSVEEILEHLKTLKVKPEAVNANLTSLNTAMIKEKVAVHNLLRRPEIGIQHLLDMDKTLKDIFSKYSQEEIQQAEIQIKYETYIDKEEKLAEKMKNLESFKIPSEFDFDKIMALSAEAREKFKKVKPETIGQASRISGVSPADISIIMVYLEK
jgi:tRNA uridine 5-carboxymethylaminomethyl modification enzyme